MHSSDPRMTRVVRSISALFERELSIEDSSRDPGPGIVSKSFDNEAVTIMAEGETVFSEKQRSFLEEIAGLILEVRSARAEAFRLDERLRNIERENVDLTMRNRALADVSSRDALTGLYARWYVMQKIEEELNRALRHGSPLAVLMVDLDHFKRVNDSFGHRVGDQVLQTMGQLVKDSLRVYDIPGRYGGEEFCLMLPETRIDNTSVVAERIRQRVASTPIQHRDGVVSVTASIGVAGVDDRNERTAVMSAGELIERADQALYASKRTGRNRVTMWSFDMSGFAGSHDGH